jgi:hypothetical protein
LGHRKQVFCWNQRIVVDDEVEEMWRREVLEEGKRELKWRR